MNINEVIKGKEYDFLKDKNGNLKKNIGFVVFGGSISYGTNHENSDIDIRGVYFPTINGLINKMKCYNNNTDNFIKSNDTDTTLYEFHNFMKLASYCNPSVIEMLGCKSEHYIMNNPYSKILIDNRKMFISRKALFTFGNYVNTQLNIIEYSSKNNINSDSYDQLKDKEFTINRCIEKIIPSLKSYNHDDQSIRAKLMQDIDGSDSLVIDGNFELSIEDFSNLTSCICKINKQFKHHNYKKSHKDSYHINKAAMHLIRLYLIGIDLFESYDIITYREKDIPLLMDILNGKYSNPNNTLNSAFFDLADDIQKRFNYAVMNSSIPDEPDYNKIDLIIELIDKDIINSIDTIDYIETKKNLQILGMRPSTREGKTGKTIKIINMEG